MGRDVGLGAAELAGQIGDALFPGLQGEQDGQPGGVGQLAEQAGGLPGGRGVGSQGDRHAVTVAAPGGARYLRGMRDGEGLDVGPGQGGQQRGAGPGGAAAAGGLPGEVVSGQRAGSGRGGAADAGHGDAVLAGDLGEEPAGDASLGFQPAIS